MKRASPSSLSIAPASTSVPSAENAELALREVAGLMAPIALWLLRQGVSYPAFAEALKRVFLEAAQVELARGGAKPTQSALSTLSGVHRKDVRTIGESPATARVVPRPPLASQVFTRWLTDRRFRAPDGQPRALPRNGARRSFESLCRELSNDVHPRTVLDELLRLGQVGIEGDNVVVLAQAFVPSPRLDEMTTLFAANASDHLAAAVSNITQDAPKFLEQSIYADGLTAASIELLHETARQAWAQAFDEVVTRARERVDGDAQGEGEGRMRFGVYFYSESGQASASAPALPQATAARKTSRQTKPSRTETTRRAKP